MSPSRRQIDVSSVMLDLPLASSFVDWSQVFGAPGRVEIEVGSGKGLFLANAGASNPGRRFLGLELSHKYANLAAQRIVKSGLSNVRVWQGDARLFLHQHVPPASLVAVHVYFPDPWWKTKHKKRRVFNQTLVDDLARALAPGGELWIATDVKEYFHVMNKVIASHRGFVDLPFPESAVPEHDLDYLTNFERKYRLEGRAIERARYRFEPEPAESTPVAQDRR